MVLSSWLLVTALLAMGCTPRHSNPNTIKPTPKTAPNLPIKSFEGQGAPEGDSQLPEPGSCKIVREAPQDCNTTPAAPAPEANPAPVSTLPAASDSPAPVSTPTAVLSPPAPVTSEEKKEKNVSTEETKNPKKEEIAEPKKPDETKPTAPKSSKGAENQDPMLDKATVAKARHKLDQAAQDAEKKDPAFKTTNEQEQWDKLMEYVVVHRTEEQDSMMGRYFSIADLQGKNRNEAHIGNFFSVVGGLDSKGQIGVNRVEVVHDIVTVDAEKKVRSEQWRYLLARTGQLANFWHVVIMKDEVDHVLDEKYIETTDEQRDTKFNEIKNYWYARMTAGQDPVYDDSKK